MNEPDLFTAIKTNNERKPIRISQVEADRVLAQLRFNPCWITERDLAKNSDVSERKIRAIGEMSGEIISTQEGLKHIMNCSIDEVWTCIYDLQHRAKMMGERAQRIINNMNKRGKK